MVHEGPPPPPPPVFTVTAAVHVATTPVGLTAVPVKVVLLVIAFELTEPAFAGVTEPTPWSMVNVSALSVVHVSVVWSPEFTAVGLAESVHEGAPGGFGVTVIAAAHVTVPPAPVAVPV